MYNKDEIIQSGKSKFLEVPRYREIKKTEYGYSDLEDIENTDSLGGTFSVYESGKETGTLYQYKQKMYIINSNQDPIEINYKDLCGNDKKYDLKFNDKEKNEQIPVYVEKSSKYLRPNCSSYDDVTTQDSKNQVILKLTSRSSEEEDNKFITSIIYKEFNESFVFRENGKILDDVIHKNKKLLKSEEYDIYGRKRLISTFDEYDNKDYLAKSQCIYYTIDGKKEKIGFRNKNTECYNNTVLKYDEDGVTIKEAQYPFKDEEYKQNSLIINLKENTITLVKYKHCPGDNNPEKNIEEECNIKINKINDEYLDKLPLNKEQKNSIKKYVDEIKQQTEKTNKSQNTQGQSESTIKRSQSVNNLGRKNENFSSALNFFKNLEESSKDFNEQMPPRSKSAPII